MSDNRNNTSQLTTALIAASESSWRNAYADACASVPCRIHTASGGFEAIECLRSRSYDVVVIDKGLADLDPFELNLYVRELAANDPFVLLSGIEERTLPDAVRSHERLRAVGSREDALRQVPEIMNEIASGGDGRWRG